MAYRSEGGSRSGGTLLRQYLDEIGTFPLLTAADEVELGQLLADGRAAEAELEIAHPTPRRRRELQRTIRNAADARRRFIQANLRLVVSVARKYEASGLPVLDLIQEGNLGLMRAVEKFDHTPGLQVLHLRHVVDPPGHRPGHRRHGRTIRVPAHVAGVVQLDRPEPRAPGRARSTAQPTPAEVAADTGLSTQHVELALRHRRPILSLSSRLSDDSDAELGDLVEDPDAEAPYEVAAAALEREALRAQLARLNERERAVLALRFGLDTDGPRTLAQVGDAFDLTRERIRQIEARALGKLRHPSVARLWTPTAAAHVAGSRSPAQPALASAPGVGQRDQRRRPSRAAAAAGRRRRTTGTRRSPATVAPPSTGRRRPPAGRRTSTSTRRVSGSTTTAGSPTSSTAQAHLLAAPRAARRPGVLARGDEPAGHAPPPAVGVAHEEPRAVVALDEDDGADVVARR